MSGANDGSGGGDCWAGDTGVLLLEKREDGVRLLSLSKPINLLYYYSKMPPIMPPKR